MSTYILLVDFIGERRTRGERYKTIVVNKGALLKGPKPHEISATFSVSKGNPRSNKRYHGASVQVPGGKQSASVAPLCKTDYDLLKGVSGDKARYEVFTSGRLEAKVGDTVFVRLPRDLTDKPIAAILKWKGTIYPKKKTPSIQRDKELKFGIEIVDRRYCGQGDSNGRLNGVCYFDCSDNCGCFVGWQDLYLPRNFDDTSGDQFTMNTRWAISTETLLSSLLSCDNMEFEVTHDLPKQMEENSTTINSLGNSLIETKELHAITGNSGPATATTLGTEWWKIPKSDIFISSEVVKTAEWGYITKGVLCGQTVAVKCFDKKIMSKLTEKQVKHEISLAAQIHHPNLLLFIGAVLERDVGPFLVAESLDYTLLSAYEDQILHERSKLFILRDVASALNYLHSHHLKVAHGAVECNNILLEALRDERWKAKLSMFALVRWLCPQSIKNKAAAKNVSKFDIMSSEQFKEVVTPKMDIYCFGLLIFKLLFGVMPSDSGEFISDCQHQENPVNQLMYKLAESCTKDLPSKQLTMKVIVSKIDDILLL